MLETSPNSSRKYFEISDVKDTNDISKLASKPKQISRYKLQLKLLL